MTGPGSWCLPPLPRPQHFRLTLCLHVSGPGRKDGLATFSLQTWVSGQKDWFCFIPAHHFHYKALLPL